MRLNGLSVFLVFLKNHFFISVIGSQELRTVFTPVSLIAVIYYILLHFGVLFSNKLGSKSLIVRTFVYKFKLTEGFVCIPYCIFLIGLWISPLRL